MVESSKKNTCIRGCCWSETIPLHVPPSSFSLLSQQPIARGSESSVFLASLAPLHGDGDGDRRRRVAAKKPILSTSDDLDKFHRELQLWCKVDHPGLAKLVAAHARPPNYMFFFEMYENGNLADRLHVQEWSPSLIEALTIASDLANALKYLHDLGIVHRDLKPANVLLDKDLHPHLGDFGLATYKDELKHISLENWRSSGKPTGGFHKKNMVGTLIYMAPEVLKKDVHTEKSDIYSFAILINELLTGVVPYTDLRAEAQAHTVLEMSYTEQQLTAAVVSEGLRPMLAPECSAPSSLLSLIQRCWDSNPSCRPTSDDIIEELNIIMKQAGREQVDPIVSSTYGNNLNALQNVPEDLNWFTEGEELLKKSSCGTKLDERLWPSCDHDSIAYRPTLSCGSFETCGMRETMEDAHFLLPQMSNDKEIHMFGIFDGHRGAAAAQFSARALPGFLQASGYTCNPSDALTNAFLKTDATFREELMLHRKAKRIIQKDWHPGCAAVTVLIVRNKLFVANAGDCRAILCRGGHPFQLTKDHVASCQDERKRVIREGMEVKWQVDTWRVGPAALQVTRSIGDDDLKPAVTAEPELSETSLSAQDEYMVMASDGLWDVISNEDVVSIIRDTVKEPAMCSKRLATEAAARGSGDNITVVVVFLRPVSTAERVY